MKKYLIAVSAAALLISTAGAQAADIVSYQPEPVAVMPVFTWTGFYAGGTIGGAWGNAKSKPRHSESGFKKKIKPDGFIGGLYAGYNFQLANNVVLGAETDFLWGDVKDSGKKNAKKLRIKEKWDGSTRLRAGYAFDRFLPYIAAGVSYAKIKGSLREVAGEKLGSKGKTRTGWNIGLGVDYIPPIMNDHLVLRAEYRYSDFGKKSYKFGGENKYRIKYNQNDFRVGVAYKF